MPKWWRLWRAKRALRRAYNKLEELEAVKASANCGERLFNFIAPDITEKISHQSAECNRLFLVCKEVELER